MNRWKKSAPGSRRIWRVKHRLRAVPHGGNFAAGARRFQKAVQREVLLHDLSSDELIAGLQTPR